MIGAFLYGIALAIGLIIPLGAQNIFIFNQGATQRHYIFALPSVLAAFICDLLLILVAVFGISLIVLTIPWLKNIIFGVGILFLIYMGIITWSHNVSKISLSEPLSLKGQICFAISVSILNPHAILDTIGVIGANALHFTGHAKLAFTLACILVSFCWFLSLSIVGHYFRKLDQTGFGMIIINKVSAIIMWGLALYLVYQTMTCYL